MRSGTSARAWLAALVRLTLTTQNLVNGRPLGSSFGIPGVPATYDYIVVGGGTAGLTLASRLVEQDAGSVAVVEDGTFYELSNGNLSEVPAWAVYWNGKSPSDYQPLADWGYDTVPQAVSRPCVLSEFGTSLSADKTPNQGRGQLDYALSAWEESGWQQRA